MNKIERSSGYSKRDKIAGAFIRDIREIAYRTLKYDIKLGERDTETILEFFFAPVRIKRKRLWRALAERKIASPFIATREQLKEIAKELRGEN